MPAHRSNAPPPPNEPDDGVLIRRLAAGDQAALRALMDRYDRLVRYTIFRACRERCASDPDWLDARASESWTGIIQSVRRPGFSPPAELSTYLIQVARNKCRDAVRIAGAISSRTAKGTDHDLAQLASNHEDAADYAARVDDLANLRACLATLEPDERALCAELPLIIERRWQEAADRLGLAESTLRTRWDKVLQKLRSRLGKKN